VQALERVERSAFSASSESSSRQVAIAAGMSASLPSSICAMPLEGGLAPLGRVGQSACLCRMSMSSCHDSCSS